MADPNDAKPNVIGCLSGSPCPKCLAYHGHHPECTVIDFETAKKMLSEYYRTWLEMETKHRKYADGLYNRIKKAKKEAEFWKGKFNTVKIENNSMRKKLFANSR
jgi:hypothetical protein